MWQHEASCDNIDQLLYCTLQHCDAADRGQRDQVYAHCAIGITPEWEEDEKVSHSLKLRKLSSTIVKPWSTPELKLDGVLGEIGMAGISCSKQHHCVT